MLSGLELHEQTTPNNYTESQQSEQHTEWNKAMKQEYDGCVAQGVWTLVERQRLPIGTNIIPVRWVYKIKTNHLGEVTKYKARITPKGFKQQHGVDYFEIFANTGKYKSLRVLLSIAARKDLELRQLDVPQAFTQAELDEVVYMEMPDGYKIPGTVCKLTRSLYGLKQSPRNWYKLFSSYIKTTLKFKSCVSDPCLFYKQSKTGQHLYIFLFVDDLQIAFDRRDASEYEQLHMQLQKRFNITNLGESEYMLGMYIQRDRQARTITVNQPLYISSALKRFDLQDTTPRGTPGQPNTDTTDTHDADHSLVDINYYQQMVGTLLYASISTRPDIAYTVNRCAQRMTAPTQSDLDACVRVFKYLAGTQHHGLIFGRNSAEEITVSAYADADWGSDKSDRKSITGWIGMINGDPVSWASKKQRVVAQSTCEAELYAQAAAMNECKWLEGLLCELGIKVSTAPIIYGDNQGTQALSINDIKSERTKHIDIKLAYIQDTLEKGEMQLKWIPTRDQIADILTKSLNGPLHTALLNKLTVEGQHDKSNTDKR